MGACCSAGIRAEEDRTPLYYHCPRAFEGQEHLSFSHVAPSTVSSGLYMNSSLQSSLPDSYRERPMPFPHDVGFAGSQTIPGSFINYGTKASHMRKADSQIAGQEVPVDRFEIFDTCESLKGFETKSDGGKNSGKDSLQLNNYDASDTEEDVCPTCLEEYDSENPRILTKCQHHFHLSCILEWMERSDTCPICDKIMMIN